MNSVCSKPRWLAPNANLSEFRLSEEDELPPFVIVHLMRHATSIKGISNPGITYKGQRNADDFAHEFKKHAPYITNILSSPMVRTVETANRALAEVKRCGVPIDLMPALAGSQLGDFSAFEDSHTVYRPSIGDSRLTDIDFAKKWFTLRGVINARNVREIVVVTHGNFLATLLGPEYRPSDFSNDPLVMKSYFVKRDGILQPLHTLERLEKKRNDQRLYKTQLEAKRVELQKAVLEEAAKREQKRKEEKEAKILEQKLKEKKEWETAEKDMLGCRSLLENEIRARAAAAGGTALNPIIVTDEKTEGPSSTTPRPEWHKILMVILQGDDGTILRHFQGENIIPQPAPTTEPERLFHLGLMKFFGSWMGDKDHYRKVLLGLDWDTQRLEASYCVAQLICAYHFLRDPNNHGALKSGHLIQSPIPIVRGIAWLLSSLYSKWPASKQLRAARTAIAVFHQQQTATAVEFNNLANISHYCVTVRARDVYEERQKRSIVQENIRLMKQQLERERLQAKALRFQNITKGKARNWDTERASKKTAREARRREKAQAKSDTTEQGIKQENLRMQQVFGSTNLRPFMNSKWKKIRAIAHLAVVKDFKEDSNVPDNSWQHHANEALAIIHELRGFKPSDRAKKGSPSSKSSDVDLDPSVDEILQSLERAVAHRWSSDKRNIHYLLVMKLEQEKEKEKETEKRWKEREIDRKKLTERIVQTMENRKTQEQKKRGETATKKRKRSSTPEPVEDDVPAPKRLRHSLLEIIYTAIGWSNAS